MRLLRIALGLVLVAYLGNPVARADSSGNVNAGTREVRFAVTNATATENVRAFEKWAAYLSRRIGQAVIFTQRQSRREVIALLSTKEADFAWIPAHIFSNRRDPEVLRLLALPVFEGRPRSQFYLIVRRGSAFAAPEDLAGRVLAFPGSETRSDLAAQNAIMKELGFDFDRFFRLSFATPSHQEILEAVIDRVADAGVVDGHIWQYIRRTQPQLAESTRILARSSSFGLPPLVVRLGAEPDLVTRMESTLLTMDADPDGRAILNDLMLDRFSIDPKTLIDYAKCPPGLPRVKTPPAPESKTREAAP